MRMYAGVSVRMTSQGYCSSHPIITARFYLPALGAVATLAAWGVDRMPRRWSYALGGTLLVVGLLSGVLVSARALDGDWNFAAPAGRPGAAGPPPVVGR